MTYLYLCRTDGDQYRMVKMTSLSEVESSYLCSERECQCPAGVRPTCRHREMLPRFLERNAINTGWAFDYDRGGWVQTDYGSTDDAIPAPSPNYIYAEEDCPGHIASDHNPKVCGRCGVHIDSLRPDEDVEPELPAPTKPKALFIRRRV